MSAFTALRNKADKARKQRNREVYEEGRQAALAGRPVQTNPYRGLMASSHWCDGYEQGMYEKEKQDAQS